MFICRYVSFFSFHLFDYIQLIEFLLYRRQQAQMLPIRTPTWLKLYEVLVQLEKNIEDALPEFQELILGIQ